MSQQENLTEDQKTKLIGLHLAEYQALTTRASYWMVLQISLLPAVPVYILLTYQAYQVSNSSRAKQLLIWSTLAVLHLVALLWTNMMLEQFALVRYIECYLRPRIKDAINTHRFWLYEPYLVKHRPINPSVGNYSIAILSFVVMGMLLTCRLLSDFSRWDAGGLIVNLALSAVVFKWSHKIGQIQRYWAECDTALVQEIDDLR